MISTGMMHKLFIRIILIHNIIKPSSLSVDSLLIILRNGSTYRDNFCSLSKYACSSTDLGAGLAWLIAKNKTIYILKVT